MRYHTGADAFGRNERLISISPGLQCGYAPVLCKEGHRNGNADTGNTDGRNISLRVAC